jgi:ABC-type uncharacterized transport system involved in gliding motility auxiliary subunit
VAAEGYTLAPLDLRQTATGATSTTVRIDAPVQGPNATLAVPDDAAVVMALGPVHPLWAAEKAALEAYLQRGGRLMVFLEPRLTSGLETLLRPWRIAPQDDLVVDPSPLARLLGLGAAAPMVQPVQGEHPIVEGLSTPMVMSTVRSLALPEAGHPGVEVTPLAAAAQTAWGETHMGTDGTAHKDADDHLPPLFVAVAAERTVEAAGAGDDTSDANDAPNGPRRARLVVYGDSDWVTNKYLDMQGNRDFVLNGLNWLAEHEDKITIRPKTRAASQLYLSGRQMNQITFLSMDILPVLIVAAGLGITLVRRSR